MAGKRRGYLSETPRQRGRPPVEDRSTVRTVRRELLLTPDEAAAHDAARGEQPWGEWVRERCADDR